MNGSSNCKSARCAQPAKAKSIENNASCKVEMSKSKSATARGMASSKSVAEKGGAKGDNREVKNQHSKR